MLHSHCASPCMPRAMQLNAQPESIIIRQQQITVAQCSTFEANAREDSVSMACAGLGARLAIISALALPPSESCSSIVSLEFLQRIHDTSAAELHDLQRTSLQLL